MSNSKLHKAVIQKDLQRVKKLLQNGANYHSLNDDAKTPLELAVAAGYDEIILELLLYPNPWCDNLSEVPIIAAKKNNLTLLKTFFKLPKMYHGKWFIWHDKETKNTPLHYAVLHHNLEMVTILLNKGMPYNDQNINKDSALDLAIATNHRAIILALLSYSNLKARDPHLYLIQHIFDIELIEAFYFHFDWRTVNSPLKRAFANKDCLPQESSTQIIQLLITIKNEYKLIEVVTKYTKTDKLKKIQELLTPESIFKPLSIRKNTLLGIAARERDTPLVEYLISQGANSSDLPLTFLTPSISKCLETKNVIKSNIDHALIDLNLELNSIYENNLAQPDSLKSCCLKILIDKINTHLIIDSPDLYQKIDLYCLSNQLLAAFKTSTNDQELSDKIRIVFCQREAAILNTRLDYCYDTQTPANRICYALAKQMVPEDYSPYNLLLHQARTEDRKEAEAWFDPIIGVSEEEAMLPDSKYFFRLPGNEIHLYEYVVEQAIVRIKEGNRRLAHIWFGTDSKNVQPVPPLNQNTLMILKQRSASLKKLIEYSEYLDCCSRQTKSIIKHLEVLRDGLRAGNYHYTGKHELAGDPAYMAIIEFSDWFNTLNSNLQRRILAVKIRSHGYSLEYIIRVRLSISDINPNISRNSAVFCVDSISAAIDSLLNDAEVRAQFIAIDEEIQSEDIELSHKILDDWKKQINAELQEEQPAIFLPEMGIFPTIFLHGELNSLFIRHRMMNNYQDFIGQDKDRDTKKIISFIFSRTENDSLLSLRKILNTKNYNYLREHKSSSHYYAYVEGVRVKTSRHYAMIEEALSLQLLKNTARGKAAEEVNQDINELCVQNNFINISRRDQTPFFCKGRFHFHFFGKNKTSALLDGHLDLDLAKNKLDWKIEGLKRGLY